MTGANGFIGRALCRRLFAEGEPVRQAARSLTGLVEPGHGVRIGDLGSPVDWSPALAGVEVVFHLAARVHVLRETAADPLAAFRQVNVDGTRRLARAAAAAGARRLVFLSSSSVNGESTRGRAFRESDPPRPRTPYARSKWEAEQALRRIASESGLEVVVIRPPLVYGPGAPGVFSRLVGWVDRGVPLPLASVRNRRCLMGLGNLVDFLSLCGRHPEAGGGTFLVCDGESFSLPELIREIARHLGRPPRLFPFPVAALRAGARLVGRPDLARRLLDSLEIDGSAAERELGWRPPVAARVELARAVTDLKNRAGRQGDR